MKPLKSITIATIVAFLALSTSACSGWLKSTPDTKSAETSSPSTTEKPGGVKPTGTAGNVPEQTTGSGAPVKSDNPDTHTKSWSQTGGGAPNQTNIPDSLKASGIKLPENAKILNVGERGSSSWFVELAGADLQEATSIRDSFVALNNLTEKSKTKSGDGGESSLYFNDKGFIVSALTQKTTNGASTSLEISK